MKVTFLLGILASTLVVIAAKNSQNGKNQENIQKLVQDAIEVRILCTNKLEL